MTAIDILGDYTLVRIEDKIKEDFKGIVNSMDKGVSNARAEAINRKIKDAGRRASGYGNIHVIINMYNISYHIIW